MYFGDHDDNDYANYDVDFDAVMDDDDDEDDDEDDFDGDAIVDDYEDGCKLACFDVSSSCIPPLLLQVKL